MSARPTAIVTGANKGLGYFTARGIAASGFDVFLACRDEGRANAAIQQMSKELADGIAKKVEDGATASPGSLAFLPFDLEQPSTFDTAIAEYKRLAEGRPLNVLVHNAGFAFKSTATEAFPIQATKTTNINFFGTIAANEAFLPLMAPKGRIVILGSRVGYLSVIPSKDIRCRFDPEGLTVDGLKDLIAEFVRLAQDGKHLDAGWAGTAYGMSKVGINTYPIPFGTNPLVVEKGLTVNSCCPGYCKTDMTSQAGFRSAVDGADTPTWLATSDEVEGVTGKFFGERKELDLFNGQW